MSFAKYRAASGDGKYAHHLRWPRFLIGYRNTDLLPEVPGSEAQESPGPSQHGQPTPEVHTSQTESPQHGTVVVATDYEQPRWQRSEELDSHTSPNQLPRAQNHSSDVVASRETIPIGHEAAGYEVPSIPPTAANQPEQIETFDTPASSAIANDTSAWAETLEEGESHVNRVPFYPGTPIHQP